MTLEVINNSHHLRLIYDHSLPRFASPKLVTPKKEDYSLFRKNFGWAPIKIIEKTFENTTQYGRYVRQDDVLLKHFKSRFPALNVRRRHEEVATDTVFLDTPAVDDGAKCAQLFVGRQSLFADAYGMKTDGEQTH